MTVVCQTRLQRSRDGWVVFVSAGLVVALGAANGGYFAPSWGAASLAFGSAIVGALLVRSRPLGRRDRLWIASFLALTVWTWMSAVWGDDLPQAVLEGQRVLTYTLAVAGACVCVERRNAFAIPAGMLVGLFALCAYSLATRLFPERLGVYDPIAGYRLAEPVGYWNALGLLAAIGALLALGVHAHARRPGLRVLAGSAIPVFAAATYFTFSRGAWLALALGVAVAVLIDPRRLQLLVALAFALPGVALVLLVAWRSEALITVGAPVDSASSEGRRFAVTVIGAMLVGACLTLLLTVLPRMRLPRRLRRTVAVSLVACVGVSLVLISATGLAPRVLRDAYGAFVAAPSDTGPELNRHLLSLSSSGRVDTWRAAWEQFLESPVIGRGAGSFEQWWLSRREAAGHVRDAHTLYGEALGELGVIGLLLLVVALGTPLTALWKVRYADGTPLVAGAYVAYLAHAGVDWDWEMTVVTLVGLGCGAALVVAARGEDAPLIDGRARATGLAAAGALLVVVFITLTGNIRLAQAAEAARVGDWARAATRARQARTWAPWATEPRRRLGEALLMTGSESGARAALESALSINSDDWRLWFDLARARDGPLREAALDRAVRLNPLSPEVRALRGETAHAHGGVFHVP